MRAENYKNTCEITTAIHAEGEETRALITANVIQQLRDDLTTAKLSISNEQQTAALIASLRPFPQPAYITSSPYALGFTGYGNSGVGSCGFNLNSCGVSC